MQGSTVIWGRRHPSAAHSALIHVDSHLILITKMQFPASQGRLMGVTSHLVCLGVLPLPLQLLLGCQARSRIDGFHTDTQLFLQAHLF